MRVLATADTTGSGWYRVRLPIRHIPTARVADMGLPLITNNGNVVDVALDRDDCDVIVLQRPMAYFMPTVVSLLQHKGIGVVVEIDDDFHAVSPLNTAFDFANPKTSPDSNWNYLRECIKRCDVVTVSTDSLARVYGNGKAIVLRNCIADEWLDIPHNPPGDTVGWGGTVRNHPTDLDVTHGGVARAVEECGARFVNIGGDDSHKEQIKQRLGLTRDPVYTPWTPLDGLYPYLVTRLDVGIVPLAPGRFNDSKSYLKGLEYAALGVPFVASDVAEYRLLHGKYGVGELAKPRMRDWHQQIRGFLRFPDYRNAVSWEQREKAHEHRIGVNAWKWEEAWAQAIR